MSDLINNQQQESAPAFRETRDGEQARMQPTSLLERIQSFLRPAPATGTASLTTGLYETDNYNGIFGDASNDSIVLMSNASGKIGFFGAAAVVRHGHIADATDAPTVITVCNLILSVLEAYGLLASS